MEPQLIQESVVEMLVKKNLGNGVVFTIIEQSRVIAADRWYVKVVGVVSMVINDGDFAEIVEKDPVMLARVRRQLGDTVEHQLIRDRNFVDAAVKDEVVKELVAQLLETVGSYLEVEAFPARLLARKYLEVREICCVDLGREEAVSCTAEEPVDFSHCFR